MVGIKSAPITGVPQIQDAAIGKNFPNRQISPYNCANTLVTGQKNSITSMNPAKKDMIPCIQSLLKMHCSGWTYYTNNICEEQIMVVRVQNCQDLSQNSNSFIQLPFVRVWPVRNRMSPNFQSAKSKKSHYSLKEEDTALTNHPHMKPPFYQKKIPCVKIIIGYFNKTKI